MLAHPLVRMLPMLALPALAGCKADDGSGGGGAGGGDAARDAGRDADVSEGWDAPPRRDASDHCTLYQKPDCEPNHVPPIVPYRPGSGCLADDQCPDGATCDRGSKQCRDERSCLLPWECYECPNNPGITCPEGMALQKDSYGCLSASSECGCTMPSPPSCPDGQVPDEHCSPQGVRCYSGGCVPFRCDCAVTPDCPRNQVVERDANGCITGRCVRPTCPDVPMPVCDCDHRPYRTPEGCLHPSIDCELEPIACPTLDVPVCPQNQVPRLEAVTHCLTGECVVGFCVNACQSDRDCATSDACLPYGPNCDTCQPRPCEGDLDCPPRTDCVGGRCRLRPLATCERAADCLDGNVCDDPGCGRCAPPCECRAHEDCPDGFRCADCACVAGCRTDDDCDPGLGCDPATGSCRPCACEADGACQEDLYCSGCFCLPGCRRDDQCPPWMACSLDTHQCAPEIECSLDFECARTSICVDETCIPDPGICLDGRDQCAVAWDWRLGDYTCLKSGSSLPDCPQGNDGCEPDEDAREVACLCDLDECYAAECDGPREQRCPGAPYHCSKPDQANPSTLGICREGRPEPRRLCREADDCVPEDCEVATFCVNRAEATCQSHIPAGSEVGRPHILGCECLDGVCVTDYDFPG